MEYLSNTTLSYLWSKIKTYIDNAISNIPYERSGFGNTVTLTDNIINLELGDVFIKTIDANVTFSITGVPQNKSATFSLILNNGGSYSIIWPSSVKWSYGIAPVLVNSGTDIITFMTPNGGTTWYGSLSLADAD